MRKYIELKLIPRQMGRTTGIIKKIKEDIKYNKQVLYLTQTIPQINANTGGVKRLLKEEGIYDFKNITMSTIGSTLSYRGMRVDKVYIDNFMPWNFFQLDLIIPICNHLEMVGDFDLWMDNFAALAKIRDLIKEVNKK